MSIVTPERPVDAAGAPTPSGPRRTWWHAFNSVIALGAVVIGVVALTHDPATKTVEVPETPAATPSELSSAWFADPGPIVGIPSSIGPYVPLSPATGGVPSDKYADLIPAGSVGVSSEPYADRIPSHQYDVAKEHAPVSPVSPYLTTARR